MSEEIEETPQEEAAEAPEPKPTRTPTELVSAVEALIFVADEPIPTRLLADVLEEPKGAITAAVEQLTADLEERGSGLQVREVAGGWQITRWAGWLHCSDAAARNMASNPDTPNRAP